MQMLFKCFVFTGNIFDFAYDSFALKMAKVALNLTAAVPCICKAKLQYSNNKNNNNNNNNNNNINNNINNNNTLCLFN